MSDLPESWCARVRAEGLNKRRGEGLCAMDPGELARLILGEEPGGEYIVCETCGGDPKCEAGGDGRAYCPDCDNEGEVWQCTREGLFMGDEVTA